MTEMTILQQKIQAFLPDIMLSFQEPMARHTSFRIGGPAEVMAFPKTAEELADILEVVFALAEATGCSKQDLLSLYRKKHDARGGFRDRVFLISKE